MDSDIDREIKRHDSVRILEDEDTVRRLQEGHGPWNDTVSRVCKSPPQHLPYPLCFFFPYLHTIPPHLPNKIHALGIEEEDPQYLEDEDQMSPLQHPLPTTTPNDTTASRIPSLLTHPRLVSTSTPNSCTTPQQHQIPTKCVFDFNHILILIFPNLQVPST